MSYGDFKASVSGHVIGDGECVSLVVNNARAYAEYLFPSVTWTTIFPPVPAAKDLLNDANPSFFEKIINDHNNPNQLPVQGDIMVFDATPQSGYTNTFNNPYGHTGICESAYPTGYTLLQQNSPYSGAPVNATHYAWNYRPCIGWLHPIIQEVPVEPAPQVAPSTPEPIVAPVVAPEATPAPAPEPAQTVSTPSIPNITAVPATVDTTSQITVSVPQVVVSQPPDSLFIRFIKWLLKIVKG